MEIQTYLLLTLALVGTSLVLMAWREGEGFSVLSIGPVYLGIIALYSVVPFLQLLILGLVVGTSVDNRLAITQPDEAEIASLCWLHLAYLTGFCAVYLRDRKSSLKATWIPALRFDRSAIVIAYVGLTIFVEAMRIIYVSQAKTYFDQYVLIDAIPLILRQFYQQAAGVLTVVKILLLYRLLVVDKNYLLLGLFGALEFFLLFDPTGSRHDLFVFMFSFVLLFNFRVRKISLSLALMIGLAGIAAFLGLGFFRSGDIADAVSASDLLSANSEFTAMFATAVDLQHRLASGEAKGLGLWLYLGDFIGLVPQQILPFDKVIPSDWYVHTFYPDAPGQGFGFGAISESVLGFGWIEAVGRGAIIGLLFSRLHCVFKGMSENVVVLLFYVWAVTVAYNCFRVSTFYPVHMIVFQFAPAVALVAALTSLFRRLAEVAHPATAN